MGIQLKIDVKKIAKEHLFQGAKGTYLDAMLVEKPNEYGDDGFIAQKVSKEAFQAGEKGPIIGNWRRLEDRQKQTAPPQRKAAPQKDADLDQPEDDCPF